MVFNLLLIPGVSIRNMEMTWTRIATTKHRYLMHDDRLYIWCAGTTGRSEWADNFRLWQKRVYGRLVNVRDYRAARMIFSELLKVFGQLDFDRVVCCGFSRGGAIAQVLDKMLEEESLAIRVELRLFASKRGMSRVRDLRITSNISYRGDIVPFLPPPPFYRIPPISWMGRLMLPWRAHNKAAHAAARVRHSLTKSEV